MTMQQALIEYYYQFHAKQHYFLCHDILEDAWKSQDDYAKDDIIVSLILLATGAYHHRRHNFQGAYRSYQKAQKVIEQYSAEVIESQLGLQALVFREQLKTLVDAAHNAEAFRPIALPLTPIMLEMIVATYPAYQWTADVVETPIIMHHHRYRDRSEVVAAREAAWRARHQQ